jgi:hypothetical protein
MRDYIKGSWAVYFAFATVLAFSTVPTPLYPLLQERDSFSTFVVTVVFAAYSLGVIVALFFAGHLSDSFGRRRLLVPAVLTSLASAGFFLLWQGVPGLLLGRVLSGLSVGVVTATATAYLSDLRPLEPRRAQLMATTANLGGLGLGALTSGVLAEASGAPLTVPFVVFGALLALAAIGLALVPETVTPRSPRPVYRRQRVAVPAAARERFFGAAAGGFAAFAAFGLFTSLAPSFLADSLGYASHALAGVPAFAAFAAAATAQLAARRPTAPGVAATGIAALSAGIALVAAATWLPNLTLFLAGGLAAGAGAGLLFKCAIATVSTLAAPGQQAEVLAGLFLACYIGMSVPVLGLGLLGQVVEPRVALLAFAGVLLTGVAAFALTLLSRTSVNHT